MPRVGTANLNLGKWLDGDNPGAGPTTGDSLGLNGNAEKIDNAVGTQHNADGTHKNDVINGNSLKASVADGTTLEFNNPTGSKVLRIKDGGVTGAKFASGIVDASTLQLVSGVLSVKPGGVGASQIAGLAVLGSNIAPATITPDKMAYQEYIAQLTQSGTSAPVPTVLVNTFPASIVWSYANIGYYLGTLTGAFPNSAKTLCLIDALFGASQFTTIGWSNTNTILIYTKNLSGTLTDGLLSMAPVIIRVYP